MVAIMHRGEIEAIAGKQARAGIGRFGINQHEIDTVAKAMPDRSTPCMGRYPCNVFRPVGHAICLSISRAMRTALAKPSS